MIKNKKNPLKDCGRHLLLIKEVRRRGKWNDENCPSGLNDRPPVNLCWQVTVLTRNEGTPHFQYASPNLLPVQLFHTHTYAQCSLISHKKKKMLSSHCTSYSLEEPKPTLPFCCFSSNISIYLFGALHHVPIPLTGFKLRIYLKANCAIELRKYRNILKLMDWIEVGEMVEKK